MGLAAAEGLARKNAFDASLVYGTRTFNVATGRDRHVKHREAIKGRFIDPATGRLQTAISVARPGCPLCGGAERTALFMKDGFDHHRCRCGMVYVDPVVRQDVLYEFYAAESSYGQVLRSEPQVALDRLKYRYGLDRMESYAPNPGALLDIGCGPGLFLEEARERGWKVTGMEFNKGSVARLRELGIAVIAEAFPSTAVPAGAYVALTAWDVLEHVVDPAAFVRAVRTALCVGGILLVSVPNFHSLVNRILHEKSGSFGGHSHINFFTADTLGTLVQAAGFRVCECETIITELGTIHNHLGYGDPYFGEAASVLDCLTPKYLHDRLLGSELLMVAQATA